MKNYLSLIKFSHTIFAMPFAMIGFITGTLIHRQGIDFSVLLLVVLCMIFARSAAMAFNRWLDRDIDASNPRTTIREIPAGIISAKNALLFVILSSVLFITTTYFINSLCFILSPVALAVILGYSYTKRFTALCHLILGLGLALAPVGSYLATSGQFDVTTVLLGGGVLFWVAGFDIIYALQDQEFDKSHRLFSIPVMFGTKKAMRISEIFHLISASLIIVSVYTLTLQFEHIGWLSTLGTILFLCLLVYQHLIISPTDLSKVNISFFTTNGVASVIFGTLIISDLLW